MDGYADCINLQDASCHHMIGMSRSLTVYTHMNPYIFFCRMNIDLLQRVVMSDLVDLDSEESL